MSGGLQLQNRTRLDAVLALLLSLLTFGVSGADFNAQFDAANKLYEQGKFAEAATAYQQILQSGGASSSIYFNLGNAYFKAGEIGRAIAAYEEARQLAPRDPDLEANLSFARNQVQGPSISPNWWQRWLGHLTVNEWSLAAVGGVWVCFLLLAIRQWRPAWKRGLRTWVLAAGLATLAVCGACAAAFRENRGSQTAVVLARDTPVRIGPLNESPTSFTAHDGAELRILDRKDDWLQVGADPRRIGWVRRDQVVIAPGIM